MKINDLFIKLKTFWHFLWHDDSLLSYVLNFAFAFIFIKYFFFPGLGFALSTDFPIVAIVSGSMEHKFATNELGQVTICGNYESNERNLDFNSFWDFCGEYYEANYDIGIDDFNDFEYRNGLSIGDVMILRGKNPEKIEVGDILVFEPQDKLDSQWASSLGMEEGTSFFYNAYGPVIHRVVDKWEDSNGKWHFTTKGDHNLQTITEHRRLNNQLYFENFEKDIIEDDIIGVPVVRIPWIGYAKIVLSKVFAMVTGVVI